MNNLKKGDKLYGFTVTEIDNLSEYKGIGIRLTEDNTKADIYHLLTDDKENFFSFIFKTPPEDNTGAAHIIEHCVLAGSKKYPIKDPFLSMMNGSMNTFLNAMTYPDKTVYPAASTVKKDYFNLMSVYADAVFFPLLKEEMFMQEGIRFELSESGNYNPSGVVFNEMKGAYSNHDSIAAEYSYRELFPDTVYRFDSGGEPESIPFLSYQSFVNFHKKYYHPSNCRIFLYGDIDTALQLDFLQKNVFSSFTESGQVAPSINSQPNWNKPRVFTVTSPLSESSSEEGATLTLNWKCGTGKNSIDIIKFEILSEALLGNMGAPLYKAIVESGLGEDLSPVSGLDSDIPEMVFSIGIRGSNTEKSKQFETLVLKELQKLVQHGIPETVLRGAIHKVEFRNREIKGGAPFGLRLMSRMLKGWLHNGRPKDSIEFEAPMQKIHSLIESNPRCFEELIDKSLLNNNHRLLLLVIPDKKHNSRLESRIAEAVEKADKDLSKTERFKVFQETADKKEDLVKIPSLGLEDVPKEVRKISTQKDLIEGLPVFKHSLFTNGIIYIDFAISIDDIRGEDSLLLPFLSRMICASALPGRSYDMVSLELAQKTGGIYTFLESGLTASKNREKKDYLFFRLKTLEKDLNDAFLLLCEMLTVSEITEKRRVKDLLLEMRNDFKASIIPAGHSYCASMASCGLNESLKREEEWRGCTQLLFLNNLTKNIDSNIPNLCENLSSLRKLLLNKNRFSFNITCDEKTLSTVEEKIKVFISSLDAKEIVNKKFESFQKQEKKSFRFGAISVPSAVNFSAKSIPAAFIGSKLHAFQTILAHLLKTNDLWEEVRMKNGAYGVYASVNGTEGVFTVSTYRDPAPVLNIFAAEKSLKTAALKRYTADDIKKAVITLVGRDLKPLSPAEVSLIGFRRELYCITDELRQQKRDSILSAKTTNIQEAAESFINQLEESVTVVMGSDKIIEDVSKKTGDEIKANIIELQL